MADEMLIEVLRGSQEELHRYSRELEAEITDIDKKTEKLVERREALEKRLHELMGVMTLTGTYADQRGIQLSLFDENQEPEQEKKHEVPIEHKGNGRTKRAEKLAA